MYLLFVHTCMGGGDHVTQNTYEGQRSHASGVGSSTMWVLLGIKLRLLHLTKCIFLYLLSMLLTPGGPASTG